VARLPLRPVTVPQLEQNVTLPAFIRTLPAIALLPSFRVTGAQRCGPSCNAFCNAATLKGTKSFTKPRLPIAFSLHVLFTLPADKNKSIGSQTNKKTGFWPGSFIFDL
jgi:hypothetical protein